MELIRKATVIGLVSIILFSSFVLLNKNDTVSGDFIGGPLTGTLDKSDIHYVTSSIEVPAGKSLEITKGTFIMMQGSYTFTVYGTLYINGTKSEPVRIMYDGPQGAGKWQGFIIDGGMAYFNYCAIESADTAVQIIKASPKFKYSIIRHSNTGIDASNVISWPYMFNSSIEDCKDRDINLVSAKLNMTKSILTQHGASTNNPSIVLSGGARLKAVNSTIADKYLYTLESSGNSYASFTQSSLDYSIPKIRLNDGLSQVIFKNYLHTYVGTKTKTGLNPIENASVLILDDYNAFKTEKTDADGRANWIEVTHLELSKRHTGILHDNVTDVRINYANIFEPFRNSINMSVTREEQFINNIPGFNFSPEYFIEEDSINSSFIDLWEAVNDDFDPDSELTIELVHNSGSDVGGKKIVAMKIINNRYLEVDLLTGKDNDNWTGSFNFSISATDRLGLILGLENVSASIPVHVIPINDAPVWVDIDDYLLIEDNNLEDAMNFQDHIIDADNNFTDLEFKVFDYDKTNYLIGIDSSNNLDIRVINENHTGSTSVNLSAFDGQAYGYATFNINIDPRQDSPAVNKSLTDFSMLEDTTDFDSVDLSQIFFDIDGDVLTYSNTGNNYIEVDIDQMTGAVSFKPEKDWFGQETITFIATDSFSKVNDTVTVTVLGTNDPPEKPKIILPPESEENIFKVGEPITFSAHAEDPDIDRAGLDPDSIDDLLSYIWTTNVSNVLFPIGANITFKDLPEGHHRITITVTDSKNEQSSSFIDLIIFGEYAPPKVTHIKPLPDYWTNKPDIRLEWDVQAEPGSEPFIRYDIIMDEKSEPTTVVVSNIKSKSYTVKGLRDGATYHWKIVPYISDDRGDDMSGVWFFTYRSNLEEEYLLSALIDPLSVSLYPGQKDTVSIVVTNLGNMPDRYSISIETENVLKPYLTLSSESVDGLGDGTYGMAGNEKETVYLEINIPSNFNRNMTGKYEIEIFVNSISRDIDESDLVKLTIFEIEEDDGGNRLSKFLSGENALLYIILLIIVIIIAIMVLIFAVHRKHKIEEEEEEARAEAEEQEIEEPPPEIPVAVEPDPGTFPTPITGGVSAPSPAPVPIPGPVPDSAGPTPVTGTPPTPVTPSPAPAHVPVPTTTGEQPVTALPEAKAVDTGETAETAAPAAAAVSAPQEEKKDFGTVMCGPCGATIQLTTDERPVEVKCEECGNTFTMK